MKTSIKEAYNSIELVNEYKKRSFLFNGEKWLLDNLNTLLQNNSTMLDIGVGTGRTTEFFAPYFSEYIGIDYADKMVSFAKQKYESNSNYSFFQMDATDLSMFEDNKFDFILFSFNGIDCVSIENREKILKEIKRVAKPNALFSYSMHNIFNIPKLFSFRMPKNPLNLIGEIKKIKKLRQHNGNPNNLIIKDYVYIKDGDINFTVEYYYGNIDYEIKKLNLLGISVESIFSLKSNMEYSNHENWNKIDTPWILLNCRINE